MACEQHTDFKIKIETRATPDDEVRCMELFFKQCGNNLPVLVGSEGEFAEFSVNLVRSYLPYPSSRPRVEPNLVYETPVKKEKMDAPPRVKRGRVEKFVSYRKTKRALFYEEEDEDSTEISYE
jgi:hypothetical protein